MNLRTDTKEKKMYVSIVLDDSGSMLSNREKTVKGINEQIQQLKTENRDGLLVYLTVIKFGGAGVTTLFTNKPITEVEEIEDSDYHPNGGTPMLDAIANSIFQAESGINKDDDNSFLILIISDGEENTSKEYCVSSNGYKKIADLITDRKTKGWTFTYMGFDTDLSIAQTKLNIPVGNTVYFAGAAAADGTAYSTMSSGIRKMSQTRRESTSAPVEYNSFYTSTDITPKA